MCLHYTGLAVPVYVVTGLILHLLDLLKIAFNIFTFCLTTICMTTSLLGAALDRFREVSLITSLLA